MSSAPRSDVTVLIARRATHLAVVDVLRDWSAVGLTSTVHVVDVDAIRSGEVHLPCTVVEGGTTRSSALQEELAARAWTDRARVCALTRLGSSADEVGKDAALRLLDTLREALPSVDPVPLHVVGVNLQGAAPTEDIGWVGWHNVVVAPENAQSPTAGVSPVVPSTTDPVPLVHFAAAVCSLVGAWVASHRGAFDERPVAPGGAVVAARTFTRHLSAAALESQLLARLTDVTEGYPVPLVEGESAWVVDDEVTAARHMADALVEKHRDSVFPREREEQRADPQKRLGAVEALRMLFAFLWQAVRNAPRAFLDGAVQRASAGTAALVGRVVFGGTDTQYAVVVNGVRSDGTPASWPEIDEALEVATSGARGGRDRSAAPSNADLSQLWRDFVSGGLTLLDAGQRVQELPPRTQNNRRAVVSTPTVVAADPADVYQPPENVSAYLKDRVVASYDLVAARTLLRQLDEVGERNPHVSSLAEAARHDLLAWLQVRQRSYSGRVGWVLTGSLEKVREQIASYVAGLRAAQSQAHVPSDLESMQHTLSRRLRVVGLVALAVVAILVLLTAFGPPTWVFAAVSVPVVLLVWLLTSLLMFMRGQRDLFALLHRRRGLVGQVEVLQRNLEAALEDMRRLTRAYRQYLDWCKAFGRFVQMPLGRPFGVADDEVILGTGFPLNHKFGAARPEPRVVDETSQILRRDLFGIGWTSHAWQTFLDDVPREMGSESFRVQESNELLFVDPGVARQSLLTAWAEAVSRRDDWTGASRKLREGVETVLGDTGGTLAGRLLANVETRTARGERVSMSHEDFVSGLDSESARGGSFSRAIFTEQSLSSEPWRVSDTDVCHTTADFGRTIVVTQLSEGFSSYALRLGPRPEEPVVEPVVDPPAPHRPIL